MHLYASRVRGNIQIREGTSLPTEFGAAILAGTVVETGNIQIEKMNTSGIWVELAQVEKGNIQLVENQTGNVLWVRRNVVGANLQVFKNAGGVEQEVIANTVGESVHCFENSEPFVGGPNFAAKREGQCF